MFFGFIVAVAMLAALGYVYLFDGAFKRHPDVVIGALIWLSAVNYLVWRSHNKTIELAAVIPQGLLLSVLAGLVLAKLDWLDKPRLPKPLKRLVTLLVGLGAGFVILSLVADAAMIHAALSG